MLTRLSDGRRKVTQISEVLPLGDDGHYRLVEMFRYVAARGEMDDQLTCTDARSSFADEPKVRNLEGQWELTKRIFQTRR